jgi:membrane protease YdiL (CAAX protease family)
MDRSLLETTPAIRLAIFIALTGISMILGAWISFSIVAAVLHVGFAQIQLIILQPEHATLAQFANALASLFAFLLPSIAIAYLSKGAMQEKMGFSLKPSVKQMIWVMGLALAGFLLSGALGNLTEQIPVSANFKNWADSLEENYKKALVAMTQMHSTFDLLFALIAVAVIPAMVEEIYFRSSLQTTLKEWTGKPIVAILLTAIIFSAFHFSYYGFLSRMALGIVLGCIYEYTKTLWLPILLHFINNGLAIVILYNVRNKPDNAQKIMDENLPIYWGVLGLLGILYLLSRLKKEAHYDLGKSI